VITSFASKETQKTWKGERVKGFALELQGVARRKLRMLNNSHSLADLQVPPSNRLEKFKGDLGGYYSIRINDQWWIIFKWDSGNATDVEIVDYH
jgi:proteic killer suppression protein